jgi:acyl-CoA thioester hydrolase
MNKEKFLHRTSIQIRFNDIDLVGHVNNAIYQEYFDLARMDYVSDVMKEDADLEKSSLILAHICTNYLKPVTLRDSIRVLSRVSLIGNKSIEMEQLIVSADEHDFFASSSSVLVAFDYSTQSSIQLPDRWILRITNFEGEVRRKSKGI